MKTHVLASLVLLNRSNANKSDATTSSYRGNSLSSSHHRSRLSEVLVAQAIRLIEETGPLEDSEAMNRAFRDKSGREDRLIERAWVLGQRLKLTAEIERWRDLAVYVWLALSLLVFFIAYGIAVAVIGGDRSINAVLAFFVALGMHALTLAIWCFAVASTWRSERRMFAQLSLGSLFLRLVAWLPFDRGPYSLTMLRAATSLLQRAKLLPWAFGFISHSIWALAFVLVLVALWFAFSFQEYRLTWETTILSADFFVNFVRRTGWLPHMLGFPLPHTSTLLNPGVSGSDHSAWAWWLIGCTFVYGLIPRVVLAGLSWVVWQRGKRSLKLDTADPYFRKLLARFDDMEVSTVVDAEQPSGPAVSIDSPLPLPGNRTSLAVVGFELPAEYPWPPGELATSADLAARISGTGQERRALLDKLAEVRPHKILLVCNPASSPDRGTERFIREACARSTQCALLLTPSSNGDVGNAQRWQSWLRHIGMTEIPSFTDLDNASAWFKPAHD
jgi:hypothetical protein